MASSVPSREDLLEHFKASSSPHWVVLKWRRATDEVVRVAVLRSEQRFAEAAEEVTDPASGQVLVYEGVDDGYQDQDVTGGVTYCYTCFARREDGFWTRQRTFRIKPRIDHQHKRTEFFDRDSSSYLQAMDRMRAGLWLSSMNRPG